MSKQQLFTMEFTVREQAQAQAQAQARQQLLEWPQQMNGGLTASQAVARDREWLSHFPASATCLPSRR